MPHTIESRNVKLAVMATLIAALSVASLFAIPFSASAASAPLTNRPDAAGHSAPAIASGFPVLASAADIQLRSAGLTVKPGVAPVGKTITVSGTGFGASLKVTVTLGTTTVASATSDSTGHFSTTSVVPQIPGGKYVLSATEGTTTKHKSFTVHAHVMLKPIRGHAGSTDMITGTGFAASSAIKVTFNSVQVTTGTTDSTGAFSLSFTVPNDAKGVYTVTATDAGTGSASHTFKII